jgi:hypothetical protein
MGLRRLTSFPVYPFLVALLPIIYFYEANFRTLGQGDGIRLGIIYLLITGALLVAARFVWKDLHRAALVLAPVAGVLFLGAKVGGLVSAGLLVLSLALGILFRFRRMDLWQASVIFNAMALVLAIMPIAQTVRLSGAKEAPVPTDLFRKPLTLAQHGNDQPPDIYFLLMDGMGQPAYLEKEFGLSHKIAEEILRGRGFTVKKHAMSSYPQTALSLSSTLNAGYIQDLLIIPDPANGDRAALAGLVADNRVLRSLGGLGYDLVTFPSGYPLTKMGGPGKRRSPLIDPNFLEYYALEDGCLPLVQKLAGRGPSDLSFAMRRNRLEYVFDNLGRAREGIPDEKPVFVFAHIMAPHPPFVFSRTGDPLPSRKNFAFADGSHWYDIHGREGTPYYIMYSEQFTYVMKRLGEAVDAILASSPRPPVIIIQGDHGPGSKLHHERVAYTDHEERLGVFDAWYVPEQYGWQPGEGGPVVNTFPQLFNALFDAGMPMLPPRYFFARMSGPYAYFELTPKTD